MSINWRRAAPRDLGTVFTLPSLTTGEPLVDKIAAMRAWNVIARRQFFLSALYEADPPIATYRIVGFAAATFVTAEFAESEMCDVSPGITSRLVHRVRTGVPVLASRTEVAEANAGSGINVFVLGCAWRDSILTLSERQELLSLIPASFAEVLAGYRIGRIVYETSSSYETEFARRSVVYRTVAEFPELQRAIHVMDAKSASLVAGSFANVIFSYKAPVLHLRESDQELLLEALHGATDSDLADRLGISVAAVKARWRSSFSRIAETMPNLVENPKIANSRGTQRRHLVLEYLRSHPEELRPFAWSAAKRSARQNSPENVVIR